jgi:hypothetical protein
MRKKMNSKIVSKEPPEDVIEVPLSSLAFN